MNDRSRLLGSAFEKEAPNTRIGIVNGDITKLTVDAIVNAANSSLLGGGGVDGAIHRAGGPQVLEACQAIRARQGGCDAGDAVVTTAGRLSASIIVHTVGPVWSESKSDEHRRTLASCYRRCLELAAEHKVRSIAFPNISTGIYRYPKEEAAQVAIDSVLRWLDEANTHPFELVQFVCFDEENLGIYDSLLNSG